MREALLAHATALVVPSPYESLSIVLLEGWNQGWDGDWFADGSEFSFTKAYPDFDLEVVAAYARERGVHLVGHHETSGNIAHYEPQLEAALDLYERLGIDSVKTGYVADAGGIQAMGEDGSIRFEWHDGQVMHLSCQRHLGGNEPRRLARPGRLGELGP